jgi:glycosyltransferase involved in cell wall biosynthesis
MPAAEEQEGTTVLHPRFLSLPGVAKWADGLLLALSALPAVWRLRRDFPFDVIDAHFGYPEGVAAALLGRLFGVPVVLTLRGSEVRIERDLLRRPQLAWALRAAGRVIAVSQELADLAVRLGLPRARVKVIGNGVDPDLFRPLDRAACRRELGIAGGGPFLLTVGTLSERKGAHLVIDAMALLSDRLPGLRYLLVGGAGAEGAEGEALARRAARRGIAERVLFAGARPPAELPLWYGAADLFVLPSSLEGCPNVVVEALACGTPVAATPAGSVPELLADPEVGTIVPRRDAESVAAAIASSLARPWDRARVSREARARSWEVVGREVGEEIAAALAARRAAPESLGRTAEALP